MAWIESHVEISKHPKTLNLAAQMGWSVREAVGSLHIFWHWCVDYAEDGDLRRYNDAVIASVVALNPEEGARFVKALVECGGEVVSGFVERQPYFRVHDWWDYIGPYLRAKYKTQPDKWMRVEATYNKVEYDPRILGKVHGDLRKWRAAILERDEYACVLCGSKKELHAHHIKPKDKHPKTMYSVANGVALCRGCHESVGGKEVLYENRFILYVRGLKDVSTDHPSRLVRGSSSVLKDPNPDSGWPSPQKLIELYNEIACDDYPAVEKVTEGRIKKARAYLKQFPEESFWREVFAEMNKSAFLRGRVKSNGHESFTANFDWLLTKGKDGTENAVKVFEGRYGAK